MTTVDTCTRCGTQRAPDTPTFSMTKARDGDIGWYSGGGTSLCPTCMQALLRGLPPIRANAPGGRN